jgi:tyrosine-protein phosphatase YwqE
MRFLIIFLIFAVGVSADSYKSKKIIFSSFKESRNAKNMIKKLYKTYYIRTICKDYGLKLVQERKQDGFFVVLKPFRNETLLSVVIKEIKKTYPHAYIKKYSDNAKNTKAYVLGPMPKKKSQKIVKEKKVQQKPDYSQYLRKNVKSKEEVSSNKLSIIFIILALVIIVALAWYILSHRKKEPEDGLDSILMGEYSDTSKALHVENKYEAIYVDIHSHLIPSIDDGAQNMAESLSLIKKFKELGYTKLITTPHTMAHRYPNTTQSITDGLEILKKALNEHHIDIEIEAASEYFLDENLMQLIAKGDILTFGDNYLLFEMSYVSHPVNYEAMIQTMIDAGYKPVLAHPERYLYLANHFSKYITLRAMGVYFQLNVNSLGGYYSDQVKELSLRLVDEGMISFLGSDTHRMRHLETFEEIIKSKIYRDVFKNNYILNNLLK